MKNFCILSSAALVAASMAVPALASVLPHGLYGWTLNPVGGEVDFVGISTVNGGTTFQFKVPIPAGYQARDLTYVPGGEPGGDRFYGNLRGTTGDLLAVIDPATATITTHPYTNFPNTASPFIQGVEYLKGEGLVLSGTTATTNSPVSPSLFRVDPFGVWVGGATDLPIADQDHLGANSLGGPLNVFDWNHPTGGYKINQWNTPFSTPSVTGIYSGLAGVGDPVDLAIDPFNNNDFYTSGHSKLKRFDINVSLDDVGGNYNTGEIWGIAFTPAPSTVAMALPRRPGGAPAPQNYSLSDLATQFATQGRTQPRASFYCARLQPP